MPNRPAIELKRESRINSITRSVLGDSTITEAELQLDSATEKSSRKPIAQRLCRIKPHGLGRGWVGVGVGGKAMEGSFVIATGIREASN